MKNKSRGKDKNNSIRRRLLVGSDDCCKCRWTDLQKSFFTKEKVEGVTPRYKVRS